MILKILLILLILSPLSATAQSSPPSDRKIIEFGWDEPDTLYLREHSALMEQLPFDGCVFHIKYNNPDGSRLAGKSGAFLQEAWGNRSFTAPEVSRALEDLKATQFKKFTDNFARFNVSPNGVDWFDSFNAILNNVRLLAQVAHDGGAKGILLDVEYYGFPLFDYNHQKHAGEISFSKYSTQVQKRGQEIINAIQDTFPDVTIFLTYGYTLPLQRANYDPQNISRTDYGLLPAFLNGMLGGAKGGTSFVDGYEFSYRFRTQKKFDDGLVDMRQLVLPIVNNPSGYRKRFQSAFGIWLDAPNKKVPWSSIALEQNYFSPIQFRKSLTMAVQSTDRYVWIYSENPRWWNPSEKSPVVPLPYVEGLAAVRNSRYLSLEAITSKHRPKLK